MNFRGYYVIKWCDFLFQCTNCPQPVSCTSPSETSYISQSDLWQLPEEGGGRFLLCCMCAGGDSNSNNVLGVSSWEKPSGEWTLLQKKKKKRCWRCTSYITDDTSENMQALAALHYCLLRRKSLKKLVSLPLLACIYSSTGFLFTACVCFGSLKIL